MTPLGFGGKYLLSGVKTPVKKEGLKNIIELGGPLRGFNFSYSTFQTTLLCSFHVPFLMTEPCVADSFTGVLRDWYVGYGCCLTDGGV